MSLPNPHDAFEAEIFDFLRSRPRVTYADVALNCAASDWKRTNCLRRLRRDGHLKSCGRDGNRTYFTIFDVYEANRLAETSDPDALAAEWAARRLEQKLAAPASETSIEASPATEGFDDYQKAIWTYVCGLSRFTRDDVARACPGDDSRRESFLRALSQKGLVFVWGRSGATVYYTTRSRTAAQDSARAARQSIEGEIWTAMRIKKSFSVADLHAALHAARPDMTERRIQDYCSLLTRAGYLRVMRKARHGGAPAIYRLIRNTGPLAPTSHRVAVVIDGNDDRIVYTPKGRLA